MAACAFAGTRLTRMGAGLAFGVLCAQCVVSLPNRTVHDRMTKPSCSWPETEDIREVTRYWFEHRQPNQATYVYYGAAPAFAYYLDRLRGESLARPSGWFMECWRGDAGRGCRDGTIYYGRWLRTLDTDAKLESVFETMGRPPAEFWFVMAHVQGDEAMSIGERLTKEYAIIDSHARVNASAVLLRRLP